MHHKNHHKPQHKLYQHYRKLDPKQKRKRIDQAQQSQKYRKPNPQGNCQFDQYSFVNFYVQQNGKQIKLQTYRQHAKGNIIAVIFMFHGLNSYMGHGAHLAKYFSQKGIQVVGFDHRGFGRSDGREGYVDNLQSHLSDSMKFIKLVFSYYEKQNNEKYKNIPKFILGLSMGGMTSYYITLKNPKLFDGAILMAPAMKNSVGNKVVKLTKMLNSILPDKTRLTKPIYGKATKNPQVTQFIKNDKYAFSSRMSLSTLQMIISTMECTPKTFCKYQCPFVIVQGGLDKLVNPQVAFQLYDQSITKEQDKALIFYQNMWHDIWHEEQIHQILPKIYQWILKRIQLKNGKFNNNINDKIQGGINQKVNQSINNEQTKLQMKQKQEKQMKQIQKFEQNVMQKLQTDQNQNQIDILDLINGGSGILQEEIPKIRTDKQVNIQNIIEKQAKQKNKKQENKTKQQHNLQISQQQQIKT